VETIALDNLDKAYHYLNLAREELRKILVRHPVAAQHAILEAQKAIIVAKGHITEALV